MKNLVRQRLRAGHPVLGSWLQFGHPGIAELMAGAGFDWIGIDLEHSAIGFETACHLIQIVELSGCVPLARLSSNDPVQAKRLMDAGAHGIIVPAVHTVEAAEQAVRAVRYPPVGERGVGLARAQGYGGSFHDYLREIAEYALVVVMIEHKDGVERSEKILRVPGVDAVLVGPYDLSASYDVSGQLDHPAVRRGLTRVLASAEAAGVAPGIHVVHPPVTQIQARLREGFRFLAYGGDMLFLGPAVREAAQAARRLVDAGGDSTFQ